jgi:hypothetical protein
VVERQQLRWLCAWLSMSSFMATPAQNSSLHGEEKDRWAEHPWPCPWERDTDYCTILEWEGRQIPIGLVLAMVVGV